MASLKELTEERDALQYRSKQIYQEATSGGSGFDWTNVRVIDGSTEEKQAEWGRIEARLNEVTADWESMKRVETEMRAAANQYEQSRFPVNTPPHLPTEGDGAFNRPISIREELTNSSEFKILRERKAGTARIELPEAKTLITLTTVSPQNDRRGLVNMRLEDRTVMDMIGESPASSATVEWYEETTVTNAAAETAEGSAKPEAALAWTLRSSAVKTIAVWIPVTVQALDDVPFLESQIRDRLVFMVRRRQEQQVLTGDATGENLRGILNTSGIQTQAKGADSVPTAVFKAIQKVRGAGGSGFAEPDGIVMHPNDYTDFYTLQDTTGNFVLQAILQQNEDPRIWGMRIRQTTAITENTALVGAYALGAEIYTRGGLSVAASTEHASYFTENKVAIRAEVRMALAVMVPTAFCTVTGI